MKKIIAIVLVVMLIASMTISASAATIVPLNKIGISFKMPSIVVPDIPASTVHENAKAAIQSNIVNTVMNNWLKAHPWK